MGRPFQAMLLLSIRAHKLFEGQKALLTFFQFLETLKNTKFHIAEVCTNITALIYHLWVVPKCHMISNFRYHHFDLPSLGCAQLPHAPKFIVLDCVDFIFSTWTPDPKVLTKNVNFKVFQNCDSYTMAADFQI